MVTSVMRGVSIRRKRMRVWQIPRCARWWCGYEGFTKVHGKWRQKSHAWWTVMGIGLRESERETHTCRGARLDSPARAPCRWLSSSAKSRHISDTRARRFVHGLPKQRAGQQLVRATLQPGYSCSDLLREASAIVIGYFHVESSGLVSQILPDRSGANDTQR